ncbi:MAG: iron ABC transporter substrate-binding protein [Actinobacteria bacterium]|nr:iron ABC transporter substrate-binding protein [Actinomycetota bacterium]
MKKSTVSLVALLALIAVLTAVLAGCGSGSGAKSGKTEEAGLVDLAGRSLEIDTPAHSVVAIGPGALRLVCYTGDTSKVVGIENMEKQWATGRPYIIANPELLELPVIGEGGPDSAPDPEMLMAVDPDVIFVAYLADKTKADELQSKTGIPVVVLSYGDLGTFDDALMQSIELVGEVTGSIKRADEVVDYLNECRDDLIERTENISGADKPAVYAGGLGMKGTHGIESTSGEFPPFTAINANNVVDETGKSGSVMIDKEKLLEWDPDFIFVDESGLAMVKEDYAANPGLYSSLKAVKDGSLYGYLPYNYYTTNVGTAVADAYFMGKTIYPDAFKDIKPAGKADEIYEFLLGEPMYDRMAKDFGGFKELDLSAEQ